MIQVKFQLRMLQVKIHFWMQVKFILSFLSTTWYSHLESYLAAVVAAAVLYALYAGQLYSSDIVSVFLIPSRLLYLCKTVIEFTDAKKIKLNDKLFGAQMISSVIEVTYVFNLQVVYRNYCLFSKICWQQLWSYLNH